MTKLDAEFERDKFFINQKHLSIGEKYYIYDEDGNELMYVERPARLFGRRHITVFSDDSKSKPLIYVHQDRYWEIIHKNFTVSASDGAPIANLSRNNFASLFRRGWTVKDTSGKAVAKAREDSVSACHRSTSPTAHTAHPVNRCAYQNRLPPSGTGYGGE